MAVAERLTAKDREHRDWQAAVEQALFAGLDAVDAAQVQPMYVGTPKNMVASLLGGDDGGFDPDQPVYYVEGGVCGFAWVTVRGNRRFQNWLQGRVKSKFPASAALVREAVGEPSHSAYERGTMLWVRGWGQSMQRKEAFARAFAKSLHEALGDQGVEPQSESRMD